MAKTLLQIVTLEKTHFEKQVEMIVFDGVDGQIGILPGHAPMTAALSDSGVLRAYDGDYQYIFYIAGGFAKITADKVTILTEAAECPEEIDALRVQKEIERQEHELTKNLSNAETTRHKRALRRALVRLEVSSYPIVHRS